MKARKGSGIARFDEKTEIQDQLVRSGGEAIIPRWHSTGVLTTLVLGMFVAGCGSGPSTYPVEGRVTMDGTPLTSGSVQFVAVEGVQYDPVGTIGADGTYRLVTLGKEGAPLGKYKVLVRSAGPSNPSDPYSIPKSTIPEKYGKAAETDVMIEVVSSPAPNSYDIKLGK